jgi:hypothetical protein
MLFYLELPPHTHHHKHTKNSQPGIKRGKQICRQVCECIMHREKKKFKPPDENPSFPDLVPGSLFLSLRGTKSTRQRLNNKPPEAIEKYRMRNKGGGEKTQRPGTEGHLIRMATSSNLRSSDKTP